MDEEALLAEAVALGAVTAWRRTEDGTIRLVLPSEHVVEGTEDVLRALQAGLTAFGPLDVHVDYRPQLRARGRLVVPAEAITAHTVRDILAAAHHVYPHGEVDWRTSDAGDLVAEVHP